MRPSLLLLAALLPACIHRGGEDKAEDTDTTVVVDDTDVYTPGETAHTGETAVAPDDTEPPADSDTGPTDTGFRPTDMVYGAEIGVDGTGALSDFTYRGNTFRPTFIIALYVRPAAGSITRLCQILYTLDPAAFAYVGQAGADADLLAYLDANGLDYGIVVRPGLYTATQIGLCDKLPAGFTTDLPADALTLFNGGTPVVYLGYGGTPAADVATFAANPAYAQSDTGPVDAAHLLGGRLGLPFSFLSTTGATVSWFDVGGTLAETDDRMAVVFASPTLMSLRPVTESWVDGLPGQGFYRMMSPYGWSFQRSFWTP